MNKCLWLSLLLLSTPALAQKFTVKKVKGTQAIIELTDGVVLTGKSYELGAGGDGGGDLDFTASSTGRRGNFIGVTGNFSSLKSSPGGITTNKYGVGAIYGWNLGHIEYGVGGSYASIDTGSGATVTFMGVGKFDYNISPNRAGASMLFGAGIEGAFGQSTPSGGTGASVMTLYPSGFLKWFPLRNSACLRADLGFANNQTTVSGTKSTESGLDARAGFQIYF